jgi:ribosomal protein S12 methylthiotransferase
MVSLGCAKNLVDSEKMLGLLAESGLVPTGDELSADALVVNTCGFLEAAKDESLEVIEAAARRRETGQLKRLVVAGCLVQRHRARLLDWCPQIDAIIGVFDRDRIVQAVRGDTHSDAAADEDGTVNLPVYSSIAASALLARRDRGLSEDPRTGYYESDQTRLRLTPRHWAYLRISEGCNQHCAFCTIPSIRGRMRSKSVDNIRAEAQELFSDGAFELNLIGQDTTSYGQDINYEPGLAGLLGELDQLAQAHGGAWLRLMYAYPTSFTDAMIDAMAEASNVLKYLDIPLQHINDRVLELMRRNTTRGQIESLLERLRRRMPEITIRTTFITGYPGETDAEHGELVRFVREFGFGNMGVFTYSPEPGTPAGRLAASQAIDADVAEQRRAELMLAQQEVVFARNRQLADERKPVDVLIDQPISPGEAPPADPPITHVGRTTDQAPEIDTVTYVQSAQAVSPGEVIRCRLTGAHDYELIAQPAADAEQGASRLTVL